MRTVDLTSKYFIYQQRHGLLAALSRLVAVIEYNMLDSDFFDFRDNIENMVTQEEAEQIIDFIGYKAGIDDLYLLIDELQLETGLELTPQTILFIMISPIRYLENQLDIDEESAFWLYNKLHTPFINDDLDDLIGFMKELLLDAENYKIYERGMLS